MKKIFLFIIVLCSLLNGCSNERMDASMTSMDDAATGIIVRASSIETVAKGKTTGNVVEPIVFTGNDIMWFNETTKEIRFKNNLPMKAAFSNVQAIKFYINDEYLFSSIVSVNSLSSQIINSLVFYYNIMENKYFLLDGYPPDLSNEQDIRDQNSQMIAAEWSKFINQLKKDGKYTN